MNIRNIQFDEILAVSTATSLAVGAIAAAIENNITADQHAKSR